MFSIQKRGTTNTLINDYYSQVRDDLYNIHRSFEFDALYGMIGDDDNFAEEADVYVKNNVPPPY